MTSANSGSSGPPSDVAWLDELDKIDGSEKVCVLIEELEGSICYEGTFHQWKLPQLDSDYILHDADEDYTGLVIETEKVIIPNQPKGGTGYIFLEDILGYFRCSKSDTPDKTEIKADTSRLEQDRSEPKEYSPQKTDQGRLKTESITDSDKISEINSSKF